MSLTSVRKTIEERVSKELFSKLIDRAVDYHCRKGTRGWCDCSYCHAKKLASFDIGNGYKFSSYSNYTKQVFERDVWKDIVEGLREDKRIKHREVLNYKKREL
jgi:hypothetical protein